ncbi:MAG: hypothetical protein J5I93_23620 [Pirellulaceae bacterium]|nr:hypothetical protein [Pirellulaceae bacterium]
MPIAVACQCGQRFQARDELAGKAVKCPKCGQPLRIPDPRHAGAAAGAPARQAAPQAPAGPLDDLFDEVGLQAAPSGRRCMQCGSAMPANAILCVQCGFNYQTGERVQSAGDLALQGMPKETFGNPQLDRAARELEYQAAEAKKTNDLIPWWAYLVALAALGTFVVGMLMLPTHIAMTISGGLLLSVGFIVSAVGGIWIIVIAFQDSVAQGIMVLLIPFYQFIYCIMHWDECKTPFMLWIGGQVLSTILGMAAAFLAPMLMGDDNNVQLWRPAPREALTAPLEPGRFAA